MSSTNPQSTAKPENLDIETQIKELRDDITIIADNVRETAGAQFDQAQKLANDTVSDLETRVRKDPLLSVGIAAGVGLLVGALISR